MNLSKILLSCAGLALVAAPAFAEVVPVYSDNPGAQQWYFYNDATDTFYAGNSITGAQTPPGSLTGSVDMSTNTVHPDKPFVFTNQYAGTALSSITSLLYETLSVSGNSGGLLSPFLNIGIGKDAADMSFEGRLVFDPNLSGTPGTGGGTWDTWNTLGGGNWYFSRPGTTAGHVDDVCVQGTAANLGSTCSLASIIARHPDYVINSNAGLGVLGFRTGGRPGVDEVSYADMLTINTGSGPTTYDFTTETPEPSTWSMMALSFGGLLFVARKRRNATA